jgi:hypothetical protein
MLSLRRADQLHWHKDRLRELLQSRSGGSERSVAPDGGNNQQMTIAIRREGREAMDVRQAISPPYS